MTLTELSVQYRESGEKCRRRVEELLLELRTQPMSETERLLLRRRIYILSTMAKQTIATGRYLGRYYGGSSNAEAQSV